MGNKVNGFVNSSNCVRCKSDSCPYKCRICNQRFCTKCFGSNPRSKINTCLRCAMCGIREEPPTYQELMKLSNKDLLWMLECSNYNIFGLKEKEEIVKEIIKQFNIYYNISETKNISNMPMNNQTIPQPSVSSSFQQQSTESNPEFPSRIDPPTYSDHMHKQNIVVSEQNTPRNSSIDRCSLEKPSWVPPKDQLVSLNDIPDVNSCELLSNKQLLSLLSKNFVRKDCLEREELVNQVKNLWQSNDDNRKRKELRDQITEDIRREDKEFLDKFECKVCMDAEIDCVLLECAHMVMCIDCAKKVVECPICGKSIVRRVRVFRA